MELGVLLEVRRREVVAPKYAQFLLTQLGVVLLVGSAASKFSILGRHHLDGSLSLWLGKLPDNLIHTYYGKGR